MTSDEHMRATEWTFSLLYNVHPSRQVLSCVVDAITGNELARKASKFSSPYSNN